MLQTRVAIQFEMQNYIPMISTHLQGLSRLISCRKQPSPQNHFSFEKAHSMQKIQCPSVANHANRMQLVLE